ncbi:alpha/beta fold hydrolase [Litoricolaceae bacterium]|nr:alpha/beta fold hydrolase [Litorivicinaceae bacterium]
MTKYTSQPKTLGQKKERLQISATSEQKVGPRETHEHENLDRMLRACVAYMSAGVSPHAFIEAWGDWALHLAQAPGRQLELTERAQENLTRLVGQSLSPNGDAELAFAPKSYDHRFRHPGWEKPPFRPMEQGFLAIQDWWDFATDHLRGLRPEDAERTRFMARQMLDLLSPSNFPALNPEIIEETHKTNGKNLADGVRNLMHDVVNTITQAREPMPEGFQIGKDLACTPGEVVFRNDLFELILYAAQTDKVQADPILIVPAWIMKYYILDLSPHNSMVKYLVDHGFSVFMISWCNPTSDQADLSLEDYRERGVIAALDVVNAIVPERKVHAVGYCLGGTILAIAAAAMARENDERLASISLMAAQVDFAEAGDLLLFLDESQIAFLEDMMREKGYLDWPQMARAFSAIRSEDLIYSRAVRRYYLGKQDLPTDMGIWVSDTTRMPARMHSEYLRGLFLENRLTAGRFAVKGQVIALKDISAPIFAVGTETDHIAPWKSVYKTQLFTDSDMTFVLTSGGHNSGIINEPALERGHHRIAHRAVGTNYVGPEAWIAKNTPRPGSWWPAWMIWLEDKSSSVAPVSPISASDKGLVPTVAAPGTYVYQT